MESQCPTAKAFISVRLTREAQSEPVFDSLTGNLTGALWVSSVAPGVFIIITKHPLLAMVTVTLKACYIHHHHHHHHRHHQKQMMMMMMMMSSMMDSFCSPTA